ncbi:putative p-loop containing nucleoside triphosphate hydrolase protein [Phytophthora infestans]|uniref:Putative p-loop containing nucleoside triphosphate hydrolase protein n=1 Tax=Phytophthora infestans TaxID=4787 RepID=A0A8S9UHJ2_PHYIN|nr:putative p-loop containing nucleoside triphosphate hydrolase protein [Phytophthora infestans]
MKVEEEKALTTPVVKGLMLRHNAFSARTGGLHVILWLSGNSWQGEYEPQQPFSQNETMCTNITFGLPFDTNKYDEGMPDAAFYLLEAILSAVDSHVGTNIFKACFKRSLKDKLVLPVAQSLSFVSHCDQIAVIADGRIAKQRSLKKLMMVSNSGNEEDKEDMTSAECLEKTKSNDLNGANT